VQIKLLFERRNDFDFAKKKEKILLSWHPKFTQQAPTSSLELNFIVLGRGVSHQFYGSLRDDGLLG
jgi:hypothetical protein